MVGVRGMTARLECSGQRLRGDHRARRQFNHAGRSARLYSSTIGTSHVPPDMTYVVSVNVMVPVASGDA
jgi:hypothetical protein